VPLDKWSLDMRSLLLKATLLAPSALLLATLVSAQPAAAATQDSGCAFGNDVARASFLAMHPTEPLTIVAATIPPYWRVVPPSTDPSQSVNAGSPVICAQGMLVASSGDLLLIQSASLISVRLPDGIQAGDWPEGSLIQAIGPNTGEPTLSASQVRIWPAP
jgi:hypothetical protein